MIQRLEQIRQIAAAHKFVEIDHQENVSMVSFVGLGARINIYYSRMTVGTCLDHPLKGKTQLFRRHVDLGTLEQIFKNPRVHTGLGYIKKK